MRKKFILFIILAGILSGCATAEVIKSGLSGLMTPSSKGIYKVGRPYRIDGHWYYPSEQSGYDQVGIASWYGEKFHRKRTANGEIFNKNIVSAAHKILPLPSMVRVTNIDNGKSMLIRINDRGPFVRDRIIDLSVEAAKRLGVYGPGTAMVRVQFDKEATDAMFAGDDHKHMKRVITLTSKSDIERTPPVPDTGHFVQVGAYSLYGNAHRAVKKLKRAGPVIVQEVERSGGRLYRVRIGPFADVRSADRILTKITGLGFRDAIIVVD